MTSFMSEGCVAVLTEGLGGCRVEGPMKMQVFHDIRIGFTMQFLHYVLEALLFFPCQDGVMSRFGNQVHQMGSS